MLILTRRCGERIRIGDETEVVVLSVKGNQVRLGLVAPATIKILRAELLTEGAGNTLTDPADETQAPKLDET